MKYNVVSGWRRSGTSAMMLALKQSGVPILGFKYPFQFDFDYVDKKTGKVVKQRVKKDGGLLEPLEDAKKHNPTGFWEVSSICVGNGLHKEHEGWGLKGDVIKIPSDVMTSSDSGMIGKVVYMLRDPREVLASMFMCVPQKNKKQWVKFASLGLLHNLASSVSWMQRQDIKHIFVQYKSLIKDPVFELERVCSFLGKGYPRQGVDCIVPSLDRQEPITQSCKELEAIELCLQDMRAIDVVDTKKLYSQMKKISEKYGFGLKIS